jgi:hypothetical protein
MNSAASGGPTSWMDRQRLAAAGMMSQSEEAVKTFSAIFTDQKVCASHFLSLDFLLD